jgi:invasion protein IalB
MTQLVAKDAAGSQVMLGLSINFAFKSDLGVMIVRLPIALNQKEGLGIKVDDNKPIRLPISNCNEVACQTIVRIDEALLAEFSNGKVAKYAYALKDGKQMILPISLGQFALAYADLRAQELGSQ